MGASQFSNLSSSVSFRLSSQDEDGYITCIGLEYRPTSNVKESVDKNAWRKKIIVDEEVPMWTKTRCPIFTVQIQQHYGDRGEILFQPLLALALCKYDQSWRPPRIQNTVQGIPNPPHSRQAIASAHVLFHVDRYMWAKYQSSFRIIVSVSSFLCSTSAHSRSAHLGLCRAKTCN